MSSSCIAMPALSIGPCRLPTRIRVPWSGVCASGARESAGPRSREEPPSNVCCVTNRSPGTESQSRVRNAFASFGRWRVPRPRARSSGCTTSLGHDGRRRARAIGLAPGNAPRARAEGAVAGRLDDSPRQPHPAEDRRPQGRRPPGVVGVDGDADDGALLRRAPAVGPRRRQAAREPGLSRHPVPASAARRASKLERFRAFGGAQSYPSRTKDADDVDFSTGSVGLGVAMTSFAALVQDYLRAKGLVDASRAAGPDDRAARRRRVRRRQRLRGDARRLEARHPQRLVDHRLQPPEPRRGRHRPAVPADGRRCSATWNGTSSR